MNCVEVLAQHPSEDESTVEIDDSTGGRNSATGFLSLMSNSRTEKEEEMDKEKEKSVVLESGSKEEGEEKEEKDELTMHRLEELRKQCCHLLDPLCAFGITIFSTADLRTTMYVNM